jgi:chaperone BCS1
VLASELGRDLAMIDASSNGLDDKEFAQLLREAPDGSIIVLEDVDAMFQSEKAKQAAKSNDKRNMQEGSKLTFSGLLNAIDGVASQEGCILIMTTNHPEKLDPAFVRPGRVDVMKEIRNASQEQLKKMFLRFYSGDEDTASEFSRRLPVGVISMAKLQGFFVGAQLHVFTEFAFFFMRLFTAEMSAKATERHGVLR